VAPPNKVRIYYYNTTMKNGASPFNASLCAYCAGSSGANGIVDETFVRGMEKRATFVHIMCRSGYNSSNSIKEKEWSSKWTTG